MSYWYKIVFYFFIIIFNSAFAIDTENNEWMINQVKTRSNVRKEIQQYAMNMSDEIEKLEINNNQANEEMKLEDLSDLDNMDFSFENEENLEMNDNFPQKNEEENIIKNDNDSFDISGTANDNDQTFLNDNQIDISKELSTINDFEINENLSTTDYSINNDDQNLSSTQDRSLDENDSPTEEFTTMQNKNNIENWMIEKKSNFPPEQKKQLLSSSVYKETYNDENDHLATVVYDGDYKKWFLEALLEADLPLISYLIDLFNIDLNEPVAWDMKPAEMAEKMQNKELQHLLIIKSSNMHISEFNDQYYIGNKPSVILFDWNNTLIHTNEGYYEENEKLFENAMTFLKYLKNQNIKLGIVSNENNVILNNSLKHKQIDHLFDLIIGGGDTVFFKPAAELGAYVIEKLGGLDDNPYIWMVGDSNRDLQFALNSNFMPIGFQGGELFKGYLNFESYTSFHQWFAKRFQ